MHRTLPLFLRTWALGLTAWAFVYTREVPVAIAQSVIETDCSTDLDQPDTTYVLSGNTAGNCIITANNIILDGQNLYTVVGDVRSTTADGIDFTVRNITVQDYIYNQGGVGVATGNLVVEHAVVGNLVRNLTFGANAGNITIVNSDVFGVDSQVGYGPGNSGNITISDSTIHEQVLTLARGEGDGGQVTVTNSHIEHGVRSDAWGGGGTGRVEVVDSSMDSVRGSPVFVSGSIVQNSIRGQSDQDIVVLDSQVYGRIYNGADVTVTDSQVSGGINGVYTTTLSNVTVSDGQVSGDNVIITNSSVAYSASDYGGYYGAYYSTLQAPSGTCTITDSLITGPFGVNCQTLDITDASPELTVTPLTLALRYKDTFNSFSGVEADDVKDGDISDDVVVIGEVGQEAGVYELVYSVTDSGTTLFNLYDNATTTAGPSTASTTRTVTRGGKPAESTSVGVHAARKEQSAADAEALPGNVNDIIDTLRTALDAPVSSSTDPESLKQLIDLVRQLIMALLELLAAQGKLK